MDDNLRMMRASGWIGVRFYRWGWWMIEINEWKGVRMLQFTNAGGYIRVWEGKGPTYGFPKSRVRMFRDSEGYRCCRWGKGSYGREGLQVTRVTNLVIYDERSQPNTFSLTPRHQPFLPPPYSLSLSDHTPPSARPPTRPLLLHPPTVRAKLPSTSGRGGPSWHQTSRLPSGAPPRRRIFHSDPPTRWPAGLMAKINGGKFLFSLHSRFYVTATRETAKPAAGETPSFISLTVHDVKV